MLWAAAPPPLPPAWPVASSLSGMTVWRQPALDSAPTGVLEAGQLVVMLQERTIPTPGTAEGRQRLCVGRLREAGEQCQALGWLSRHASGGETILAPLPPADLSWILKCNPVWEI